MKKRVAAVLFCVLLGLCLLCGCGSDGGENTKPKAEVDLPKNAPSEDLLLQDIQAALDQQGIHLVLTSAETVKSRSEDNLYDITVQVNAQSNYADWEYEMDLTYSKYDQGWFLDSVEWVRGNYEVTRYPDLPIMQERVLEVLKSHTVLSKSEVERYVYNMGNPYMETCLTAGDLAKDTIQFYWEATEAYTYKSLVYHMHTAWIYNEKTDNWDLKEDEDGLFEDKLFNEGEGYCFKVSRRDTICPDWDYSGEWASPTGKKLLIISNCTKDGFDAEVLGITDGVESFRIEENVKAGQYNLGKDPVYVSSSGTHLGFDIQDEWIVIWLYEPGKSTIQQVSGSVEIHSILPLLEE